MNSDLLRQCTLLGQRLHPPFCPWMRKSADIYRHDLNCATTLGHARLRYMASVTQMSLKCQYMLILGDWHCNLLCPASWEDSLIFWFKLHESELNCKATGHTTKIMSWRMLKRRSAKAESGDNFHCKSLDPSLYWLVQLWTLAEFFRGIFTKSNLWCRMAIFT